MNNTFFTKFYAIYWQNIEIFDTILQLHLHLHVEQTHNKNAKDKTVKVLIFVVFMLLPPYLVAEHFEQ